MLLEAKNIIKSFPIKSGFFGRTKNYVQAVRGVSLQVEAGKAIGLVGESGCGKTTLARILMRLLSPNEGSILLEDKDITHLQEKKLRPLRKKFQMVFQDPYSSLNPRMSVGQALTEPLIVHKVGTANTRRERVLDILSKVGLTSESYSKYPHEFSGGQRQRIGIARALMLQPKLIIADEPVSALDVSVQAQIVNLLQDLQREFHLAFLFIAHDLKVVRHISDRIMVMYLGKIVEEIPGKELARARHPYTHALLSAVPIPNPDLKREKIVLSGDVPSPINPPSGCSFRTRCPYAQDICQEKIPLLENLKPNHQVACHLVDQVKPFEEVEV